MKSVKTCAICGWRDAVDMTDWEERMVPACGECLSGPTVDGVAPPLASESLSLTARVLAILQRHTGLTPKQVRAHLGESVTMPRVTSVLDRLIMGRAVTCELDERGSRTYWPTGAEYYTIRKLTLEDLESARQRIAKGETRVQIAKDLNVNPATIGRALKRADMEAA